MIEQLQQTQQPGYAVTTSNDKGVDIDKFMKGTTIEKAFKPGDELLVSLEAKGDVFQLEPTQVSTLKVVKDFFVRFSESDLLFSLDGEKWSEFTEAFTGSFGFSSNIADPDPVIHGVLVANVRQAS